MMFNNLKFKILKAFGVSVTVVDEKDIYLKDICVEEEFHEQSAFLLVKPDNQLFLDSINKEFNTNFSIDNYQSNIDKTA